MKKIILISVAALTALSLTACESESSEPKKVDSNKTSRPSSKKDEIKIFKVGDTVSIDNIELKVNTVNYSAGGEYSEPKDGNQFVIVNVTISNKGEESSDYSGFDFKLDDNGNQTDLSEYVSDDDGNKIISDELESGTLATGGSVTGSMIGQAKIGDPYKLVYTGDMFDNESKVTFQLN